ncbi:MAG TPA: hypothetical protein VFV19_09770 [Candidatus Polarisedimenticolaceae bacterium]|nr:hypothetical protein [Candidatus Polarisedimenticolaceae bacterium]
MSVPVSRIRKENEAPVRPERAFVLYWMIAARRTRSNFGLERAIEAALAIGKPLLVLEPLRCGYRWASDRFHNFVIDGMADNGKRFGAAGITYHPYVEPVPGDGSDLLPTLARDAALVVTDRYPCFFLPRMIRRAAERLDVSLESIDSTGLLPLDDAEKEFPTAYAFRRHLQKRLPERLHELPAGDPLARAARVRGASIPKEILARWPAGGAPKLNGVPPVEDFRGGAESARARLELFIEEKLDRYADDRNDVNLDVSSRLSPYLHFGHLSIHEVLTAIAAREQWTPDRLGRERAGKREGFWGMSRSAEAFLDEAVTWRELGYHFCARRDDYDRFEALPPWALRTLAEHASDPRDATYTLDAFEAASTHDPLWNAAQRQLVREGRIHNYLRMLWGKKILEWTPDPETALSVLIELNNKYALDGRDPNSYSGIFWVLGRFDRPWGPERPVFGVVRFMSSRSTARKMDVKPYLRNFAS